MSFQASSQHIRRLPWHCDYCRMPILAGTKYVRIKGKHDGDFYQADGHVDCEALWNRLYNDLCDGSEGMPFDLPEHIADLLYPEEAELILNKHRGFFPHAVCRIEFSLRNWADDQK